MRTTGPSSSEWRAWVRGSDVQLLRASQVLSPAQARLSLLLAPPLAVLRCERCRAGAAFIERVTIRMHPTFRPPVLTLHEPPFTVR